MDLSSPKLLKKPFLQRSLNRSVCAKLAKWFDEEIKERKIRPNIKGDQVFSMLRSDFHRLTGLSKMTPYFRGMLRQYGFKLRLYIKEVQIIKFIQ